MALLHLMAEWRAEGEARPDLTVLTVDHGLRAESREEAAMVARMAERLGLRTRFSPGRRAQVRAAACRSARVRRATISWPPIAMRTTFRRWSPRITSTIRQRPSSCGLKRGSGLDGLAAIPEESVWSGIAVLRPLLDMPKARLAATLVAAGLGWAEDPSNRDERFERARMRADGEALAKLGLTPEALARSARRLRRARAALDDCRANISRHPWRHERSRLLPDRARCAHRRAGRNRASRAGAFRQCRQRQREPASACASSNRCSKA